MAKRRLMRRRVLHLLLLSDLEQVNATFVARHLCVSPSTLRRRLREEGTSYQQLLDQVRRYRCEKTLARRWTGMTYTQYKRSHYRGSATSP